MRRIITATVLALVLSGSAIAGDVPTADYTPPPPPPPTSPASTDTTPGDIPSDGVRSSDTVDILLRIVLGLLVR